MQTLRLLAAATIVLCLVGSPRTHAAEQPQKHQAQTPSAVRPAGGSEAKRARRKAVERQRRVIFNDDMYELNRKWSNTAEGLLKGRLKPLAGTHVDTISFSVIEADAPVYNSKVQPIYGDAHGGPPPYWPTITANIKALAKAGQCPIQIVTDFAHENGMESWAHVRMNDTHDSFIKGWLSNWKNEHREFWVDSSGVTGTKDQHPLGLYKSALDFTYKEVRDRKCEIIEEVSERYDIDAFELDYIRHPVLFSNTMEGKPVTAEEVRIMTDLHRRIRRMTDEAAARRGRPILLAVRVPDSLELAMSIGLDVKTWVKEDLVDIIIAGGGYAPFSLPVKEFVDVAHPYGVKVYPCVNRVRVDPWDPTFHAAPEGHRGVASNWYAAGADGFYFWNLGTPFEYKEGAELARIRKKCYGALPELGSPQTLRGKDKLYGLDTPVLSYYRHVSSQSLLPVVLKPDKPASLGFIVADDLQAAARDGLQVKAILTEVFTGVGEDDKLTLRLNGKELPHYKYAKGDDGSLRISSELDASQVKQGTNVVEATLKEAAPGAGKSVKLTSVRLLVRYKPLPSTSPSSAASK